MISFCCSFRLNRLKSLKDFLSSPFELGHHNSNLDKFDVFYLKFSPKLTATNLTDLPIFWIVGS